jgi:hypothetical protein
MPVYSELVQQTDIARKAETKSEREDDSTMVGRLGA